MLIVLLGEPLVCCLAATSLVERYGESVEIVIEEDAALVRNRGIFNGPQPWCVANIRPLRRGEPLSSASFHQSRSSVMFLESVHRVHTRFPSLESPVKDKVNIRPSPDVSPIVMYHPDILKKFLKNILKSQINCSFITKNNKSHFYQAIGRQQNHGVYNRSPLILRLTTRAHKGLPTFSFSQVEWVGLNNWTLPDKLLLLSHSSSIKVHQNLKNYDIITDGLNYDMCAMMKIVDCVLHITDISLVDARISKL